MADEPTHDPREAPLRESSHAPVDTLRALIGRLLRTSRTAPGAAEVLPVFPRTALEFADRLLRNVRPTTSTRPRPPQVAVLGPTQTGKSTIVNMLSGMPAVDVSPLAGFTVHPHGVWLRADDGDDGWVADLFPAEWSRRSPDTLSRDELHAYALTACALPATRPATDLFTAPAASLPECVIWDSPDVDSLSAQRYQSGVLTIAAFCDVHVVVLSKEKYSDLSAWRLIELIAPLRRPLVICLNKLTGDSDETVCASLHGRLSERIPHREDVTIVTLPWLNSTDTASPPAAIELRGHLASAVSSADRTNWPVGVRRLLHRHWSDWLAPLESEHAAHAEWQSWVTRSGDEFLAAYERDYLDHPQRYDTFRRAAIELLNLLELPRVGAFIARTRQLVTWPMRQMLSAGRTWWPRRHKAGDVVHSLGVESAVLVDAVDSALTGLQRALIRQCAAGAAPQPVWQALSRRLDEQLATLRQRLTDAVKTHHEQVQRDARSAAHELYRELQKNPARLNILRGTRATIDVGYLLLAVKSGGLTLLDAVWAPATFAVTSLLMEGAAGVEMRRIAGRLKEQQRRTVREQLVERVFVRELHALVEDLDGPGVFGVSGDDVRAATAALDEWERTHG